MTNVSDSDSDFSIDSGAAFDHFAGAFEETNPTSEKAGHENPERLVQRG